MSRPPIRTYGKASRTPSSSDANPFGFSSPPFSFRLDTPPSSPSQPPAKRARITPPSSPLFARSEVTLGDIDDVENRCEVEQGDAEGMVEVEVKPNISVVKQKTQQSTLKGFFSSHTAPKKTPAASGPAVRPLVESMRKGNQPTTTSAPVIPASAAMSDDPPKAKVSKCGGNTSSQTQLRLTHLPLLHTCKECLMSYVRGGEDEAVHAKHHGRVVKGIPWDGLGRGAGGAGIGRSGSGGSGAGSTQALARSGSGGFGVSPNGNSGPGWREVEEIRFGVRGRARVVECDAGHGGAKLEEILSLIDISLSSPALPPAILARCKVYLAITSDPAPIRSRTIASSTVSSAGGKGRAEGQKERVVGAVVSQGIKWAMRVLDAGPDQGAGAKAGESDGVLTASTTTSTTAASASASASGLNAYGKMAFGSRQTTLRMSSAPARPRLVDVAAAPASALTATCTPVVRSPPPSSPLRGPAAEDEGVESVKIPMQSELNAIRSHVEAESAPARQVPGSEAPHLGDESDIVAAVPTSASCPDALAAGARVVDSGDGVMCDPAPLPTPLGIHRLYTIPSYRSLGIAEALLNAACQHTIYACPARPERGEVAFSQPTQSGARMMRRWGGGKVRVFVDDESQL